MKLLNRFQFTLFSLAMSYFLSVPDLVRAGAGDPNGPNNTPAPGWSVWRRWDTLDAAGLNFGLSNMDLGLGLDLQNTCFGEVDTPNTDQKKLETYWYRVSEDVNKIGSGQIEYGCWIDGRFKTTVTSEAVKLSLESNPCLRVQPSAQDGLPIHADASTQSRVIGRLKPGDTVTPTSVPLIIRNEENSAWIEIDTPTKGWVSNGNPNAQGNLTLCEN